MALKSQEAIVDCAQPSIQWDPVMGRYRRNLCLVGRDPTKGHREKYDGSGSVGAVGACEVSHMMTEPQKGASATNRERILVPCQSGNNRLARTQILQRSSDKVGSCGALGLSCLPVGSWVYEYLGP
jgi:hypothetical protein